MSLLHTSQPDGNATRQKQGNDSLSPPKCDSKFHTDVIAKLSLFLCVKSLRRKEVFFVDHPVNFNNRNIFTWIVRGDFNAISNLIS